MGGVCRELFVCLCDQLFGADDNTGLFMRFIDSKQGLVCVCVNVCVCVMHAYVQ